MPWLGDDEQLVDEIVWKLLSEAVLSNGSVESSDERKDDFALDVMDISRRSSRFRLAAAVDGAKAAAVVVGGTEFDEADDSSIQSLSSLPLHKKWET